MHIQDETVGLITVSVRRDVRNDTYSVRNGCVRITTAPGRVEHLFPLPAERVRWIMNALYKQRQILGSDVIKPDSVWPCCTFTVRFSMDAPCKQLQARFDKRAHTLVIGYHSVEEFEQPEGQRGVRRIVCRYLKQEAQRVLPHMLLKEATQYGFGGYVGLRVTSAKNCWGSCTSRKTINVSLFTMMLPETLVRVVLVHELCHLEQMNHGPLFRQRLRSALPDIDTLEARIRQEARRIRLWKM